MHPLILRLAFIMLTIFLINTDILANILNVPDDFETIQGAIDEADDGDTVLVQPGRYVENIDFIGKEISVGSLLLTTGNRAYIDSTVIDGNRRGSVVRFSGEESSSAILTGFTICNGSSDVGGGIYCSDSSPTIRNITIRDNDALEDGSGGGIYCFNSEMSLNHVAIYDNNSFSGGGIYFGQSDISLLDVTIMRNISGGGGGAQFRDSNSKLIRVLITGNDACNGCGGGLKLQNSTLVLQNVTMTNNTADFGAGIYCTVGSTVLLVNSIAWNNSPHEVYFHDRLESNRIVVAYNDSERGEGAVVTNDNGEVNWLDGNIDLDPLFVDPDNDNFHLTEYSPCIDAGTAFFIWEDDTLVDMSEDEYAGEAPDMGAFEYGFVSVDPESVNPPFNFTLFQNYPNPFNSTTCFLFELPASRAASLTIFDTNGREVSTLTNGIFQAGQYDLMWNAGNLPGGMYLARLKTSTDTRTVKVMLIR